VGDERPTWDAVTRAIEHANSRGIHILNLSLTGGHHAATEQAIRSFRGLVVAAAGNSRQNNDNNPNSSFPSSLRFAHLISVGASEHNDARGDWGFIFVGEASNWGRHTVCIFAPGTSMRTSVANGNFTTEHIINSGTSLAAPMVAGAAALMLSVNPSLRPDRIRSILLDTVDTNVHSGIFYFCVSRGRLNVHRAVSVAMLGGNQPFIPIRSAQDLNAIRNNPSGNFRLESDIFLSGQWTPIPNFTGILDGANRAIFSMRINRTGTSLSSNLYLGLFARLEGTVGRLRMNASLIEVTSNHSGNGWIRAGIVAGIVGRNGTISQVALDNGGDRVEVHRDTSSIGIIAGYSNGHIISSGVSRADLNGNGDIGGIVGSVGTGALIRGNSFTGFNGMTTSISYHRSNNNRSIGGIVGFQGGGIICSNEARNFTIYHRNSSGSPNFGTILGRRNSGTVADNRSSGIRLGYWGGLFNNTRRWDNSFSCQIGSG